MNVALFDGWVPMSNSCFELWIYWFCDGTISLWFLRIYGGLPLKLNNYVTPPRWIHHCIRWQRLSRIIKIYFAEHPDTLPFVWIHFTDFGTGFVFLSSFSCCTTVIILQQKNLIIPWNNFLDCVWHLNGSCVASVDI